MSQVNKNKKKNADTAKTGTNKTQAPRKNNAKDSVKETPVVNETPEEQPAVNEASETINTEGTASETSEAPNETLTLTLESHEGSTSETSEEKETPDPVKEAQELVSKQTDRPLTVFWHKVCSDPKKITKTTLYAKETLKKTDGSVTLPNPSFKDAETTPEEPLTITKDVYSLKRGKRIYYLHDVTPTDILKAKIAKEASDKAKADAAATAETTAK